MILAWNNWQKLSATDFHQWVSRLDSISFWHEILVWWGHQGLFWVKVIGHAKISWCFLLVQPQVMKIARWVLVMNLHKHMKTWVWWFCPGLNLPHPSRSINSLATIACLLRSPWAARLSFVACWCRTAWVIWKSRRPMPPARSWSGDTVLLGQCICFL